MILRVEFYETESYIQPAFNEADSVMLVDFAENTSRVKADFGELFRVAVDDLPVYEGNYLVTPAVADQTLQTAHYLMSDDVTIEKIPYYEVSNNAGGATVTIG